MEVLKASLRGRGSAPLDGLAGPAQSLFRNLTPPLPALAADVTGAS